MDYNQINEVICNAIDTIAQQKLSNIKFDQTIECTIVDNSEAEQFKYTVSTGSIELQAYSQNTDYKIKDKVYVTVPQGDYTQQLLIVGKKVTNDTTPFVYTSPMESIVNITGNLIQDDTAWSLLANCPTTDKSVHRIWTATNLALQGFTRLGIQGEFCSLLKNMNTAYGNYGLKLTIISEEDNNALQTNNSTDENNITYYKTIEAILSTADMYGDPFNFTTYYNQEAVFDISDLKKIVGLAIDFYQEPGSFKDVNKELIPYQDDLKQNLPDNLFVNNIQICCGYDLATFTGDEVILYSPQTSTFIASREVLKDENKKMIYLRWVHEYMDGRIRQVDEGEELDKKYEIRWYRYKLGSPSADEYSGVYWQRINESKEIAEEINLSEVTSQFNTFYLIFYPGNEESTYIKGMHIPYKDDREYIFNENPTTSRTSYAGNWKQEVIDYYHISPTLAEQAFLYQHTSSIGINAINQTWDEIFNSRMVWHDNPHGITDTFTHDTYQNIGCLHPISFWELFTTAFRFYWQAPEAYEQLQTNVNIFKYGGSTGDWKDVFAGLNIYTQISYTAAKKENGSTGYWYYPDYDEGVSHFKWTSNDRAMASFLQSYTNSFGTWDYVYDKYGRKDLRPISVADQEIGKRTLNSDEDYNAGKPIEERRESKFGYDAYYEEDLVDTLTYDMLYEATKYFFEKTTIPKIVSRIDLVNPLSYELDPDIAVPEEKIKAVILYGNDDEYKAVYRSNIITFTNDKDTVSKATVDSMQALSINCEDGLYGNYYMYELGGKLQDYTQKDIERTFKVYFDSLVDPNPNGSVELTDAESIDWKIPIENTMIVLTEDSYADADIDTTSDPGYIHIKRTNIADYNTSLGYNPKVQQNYYIKSLYSASSNNNTIECKIMKDAIEYYANITLHFGPKGTSGTDCTLVLNFPSGKNCMTLGQTEPLMISAHLFNAKNEEVDFAKEGCAVRWEWLSSNGLISINSYTTTECELLLTNPSATTVSKNYHILKCTIGKNYDGSDGKKWGNYDLIAYLGIPIRSNHAEADGQYTCSYLVGPTEVRYDTSGNPDYFRYAYELQNYSNEVLGEVHWEIKHENNSNQLDGSDDKYYPTINNITNMLTPLNIYVKECSLNICVNAYQILNGTKVVLWSQPLLIYQNRYPAAMLNQWDGTLQIDEANNRIMAATMVAGKKNTDNTFSGVVLGEIQGDAEKALTKQTGVYGYDEGAMSYALMEDGTAFFGKDGNGRLEINGNKSQITSPLWKGSQTGMILDLDDGYIKMNRNHSSSQYVVVDLTQITADTVTDVDEAGNDENDTESLERVNEYQAASTYFNNHKDNYYRYYEFQLCELSWAESRVLYEPISFYDFTAATTADYVPYKYYVRSGDTYTLATADAAPSLPYYLPERFQQVIVPQAQYAVNRFYVKTFDYVSCSSGLSATYDPKADYYQKANIKVLGLDDASNKLDKYINFGVNEVKYPLSIGCTQSVNLRKFKVDWDGHLYAEDGTFIGTINANKGQIAGWIIDKGAIHTPGKTAVDEGTGAWLGSNGVIGLGNESSYMIYQSSGLTIKNGTIEGSRINGSIITGGKINIGNGNLYADDTEAYIGNWHMHPTYGGKSAFYCGSWNSSKIGFGDGATTSHDGIQWYLWAGWNNDLEHSQFTVSNHGTIIGSDNAKFEVLAPEIIFTTAADKQKGIYARFA